MNVQYLWGIMKETILQNKDTIRKNVKSKFEEKMWCDKELEEKRKLINYGMEYQHQ
jgi:hypothetical protein